MKVCPLVPTGCWSILCVELFDDAVKLQFQAYPPPPSFAPFPCSRVRYFVDI